ncbi:outer membrane protein assembly factor BamB family protein [Streptacidiphilus fuscans]|uniref:PQQ-binding-like beta-propeller repeat protein n=1 Tax=Streptacidiphilus fuscans TaxID=2789292 RepID=A0A931BF75_9ACTN|nr:PQQ-binding-like beta-propeller repeat protein [Streptacidiphilus fuscans]MBF9073043.1 PQQ-binding-like beta-propeller repeat protein [Streptacidiphilus fuscans]
MERDDTTGMPGDSPQEQQQYWQQQPYDPYGARQYDYSGYAEQQTPPPTEGYYAQPTGYEATYDGTYAGTYEGGTGTYDGSYYDPSGYQQSYPYATPDQPQTYDAQGYDAQTYDPQQYAYYGQDAQGVEGFQGVQTTEQPYWTAEGVGNGVGDGISGGIGTDLPFPAQATAPEQESALHSDLSPDAASDPDATDSGTADATAAGATAVSRRERRGRGAAPAPQGDGVSALRDRAVAALGGGPNGDRKTLMTRVGIAAVALVVLGGAGIWVAGSGSSGSSPSSAAGAAAQPQANIGVNHTKSWAAPADAGATANGGNANDGLVGSWLLSNAVVRGDGLGVTAYSTTDGHKLWSVTPPSNGAVPCAMSSSVNSAGIGAVVFQSQPGGNQACSELVAVDTSSGQAKWNATLSGGNSNSFGASVTVTDSRVVAVGNSATGYDATTGKQSWSYGGPGKYCALSGSGDGTALLVQSTCADTSIKQQILSLDPNTGNLIWYRGLPSNAQSYTVLSADPAVVSVHMSDPTQDQIKAWDAKGNPEATIPVSQSGGTIDSTHGSFDPDPALFFAGNTMVAAVSPSAQSSAAASGPAVITAFDLISGKQLWRTTAQEKGAGVPVGIDGNDAVVATDERLGQPARLSHFDLTSGTETVGGTFPQGTGSLLGSGRVLYRGSTVVALPEYTGSYSTAVTAWTAAS